jgi:hypothetical protein
VVSGHQKQQKKQATGASADLRSAIKEHERTMTQSHRGEMEQAKASRENEVQRIVGQWQAEVAQMDAQNQAEMRAQDDRHREEIGRLVADGQERGAIAEGEVEPLKAKLAEAHDRLRAERHRHKEEVTRLEVELKSKTHRAEERLKDAEEALAEVQQFASQTEERPRLRPKNLTGLLPQRPLQTARLAKLWVEHALDRDEH